LFLVVVVVVVVVVVITKTAKTWHRFDWCTEVEFSDVKTRFSSKPAAVLSKPFFYRLLKRHW